MTMSLLFWENTQVFGLNKIVLCANKHLFQGNTPGFGENTMIFEKVAPLICLRSKLNKKKTIKKEQNSHEKLS